MKRKIIILILISLLNLTACDNTSSETQEASEPTPTEAEMLPTEILFPAATEELQVTLVPTQPVFGAQMGTLETETLVFTQPIASEGSEKTLASGEKVEIIGRSFGSQWYQIVDSSGETGWVQYENLHLAVPIDFLPVSSPAGVQGLYGKVITDSGEPVSSVPLVESTSGASTSSDKFGEFAIFLPSSIEGMQTIQVGTPGCGSLVMDNSCQLAYQLVTPALEMLLPDPSPLVVLYSKVSEEQVQTEEVVEDVRIRATINAEILNLRMTPTAQGTVLMQLVRNSAVYAIGKTPGGEWTQVIGPNEQVGWLYSTYLTFDEEITLLPVAEIEGAEVIQGRVITSDGAGVEGVHLTVYMIGAQIDTEVEMITTGTGEFLAYLPPGNQGLWKIEMPVQDCGVAIYDDACKPTEYFTLNNTAWVSLPEPNPIVFMFQRGRAIIEGSVVSTDGKPYINMNVVAVRDDGAFSYMTTDHSGQFRLPAGPGTWQVYAYLNTIEIQSSIEIVEIGLQDNPRPIEIIVE